jgi:predicted transposase/invertase (TIGR01784 family)
MAARNKKLNPHDLFFKSTMQHMCAARDFFEWHLPEDVKERVDLDTLEQIRENFIDERLKSTSADVVYRATSNTGTHYVYFLVEHQSTVDRKLPARIMRYSNRIIQYHERQHPKEAWPLVIPLIFYNGIKPYNSSTDIFDRYGEFRDLALKYSNCPIKLINVALISDEEIRSKQSAGLMHFVMKSRKITDPEKFTDELELGFQKVEGLVDYVDSVLNYIIKGCDIDRLIELIQKRISPYIGGITR